MWSSECSGYNYGCDSSFVVTSTMFLILATVASDIINMLCCLQTCYYFSRLIVKYLYYK